MAGTALWTLRGDPMSFLAKALTLVVTFSTAAAALSALPWCVRAGWRGLWHLSKASSLRQVAKTALKALTRAELLEGPYRASKIVAERGKRDLVRCTLQDVTTRERSLFLDAMEEVLGLIDDGRYVMMRKSPLRLYFIRDSFGVPTEFAKQKESAEFFRRVWSRTIRSYTL